MGKGGRDQLAPMERLVRILAVLDDAGPAGVRQQKLFDVAGYTADKETNRRMLSREISHLRRNGWDIENAAAHGDAARYVLHSRDTRLRVELTPRQQAELARVAKLAAMADFAEYVGTHVKPVAAKSGMRDPANPTKEEQVLSLCIYAAASRCLLRFTYKRQNRTVNPRVVQPGPSGWYLVGCEDGQDVEKFFNVARMSHLVIDSPGTGRVIEHAQRSGFDPATWQVDPPVDVTLEAPVEFEKQVVLALGPAVKREEAADSVRLTVPVTHRAAFRRRLYALGVRVQIISPPEVRREVVDELAALAEES